MGKAHKKKGKEDMKKMKKFLAMLLALVMVLGMSVTTLAAPEGSKMPTSGDDAEIVVNGVKPGATVRAYQIAEGEWKTGYGFVKYNAIEFTASDGSKVKVGDLENPKAEEITAISNIVDRENGGTVLDPVERKGVKCYAKTLQVGIYLILVTENAEKDMTAYNPMVASVYYHLKGSGDNNIAIGTSVSAGQDFEVNGTPVYAKSINPTISKEIVSPLEKLDNKLGNDTAIGEEIEFKVTTSFPSYSDAYTEVEFNIVDTLSEGLSFTSTNPVKSITVGGSPATVGKYTTTVDGQVMTISFKDSAYILDNRGKEVIVQYTAALNNKAGFNFDKNTNTVKAEYTNNPTTKEKGTTEEKRTYHYTFGIDASINGIGSEITKELLKTGEVITNGVTTQEPLNGATFKLTKLDASGNETSTSYTTTSGEGVGIDKDKDGNPLPEADRKNGYLQFLGLDAGKYVLQETVAPEGYSLNPVKVPVEIKADYNADGTLNWYQILVDGKVVEENGTEKDSKYTATYTKNETTGEVTQKPGNVNSDTQSIPNTKLIALPSTGGIGTTIFTIGGCAIMIIAAGLYFAGRRKTAK